MPRQKMTKLSVICYGTRICGSRSASKAGTALMPCDEHQNHLQESPSIFTGVKHLAAGCVYTIEGIMRDGHLQEININKNSKVWTGQVEDTELNAEIRATDRANSTALQAIRAERSAERNVDSLLECLAPLREAYRKTNHAGRLALDVRVLNYIHNMCDL